MSSRFDWAPKKVRLRSRVALGVAVVRLWVGLFFLLTGVALAYVNFQPPPEPAPVETAILAAQGKTSAGGATLARRGTPARARGAITPAALDGSAVVVGSLASDAQKGADRLADNISGEELARVVQQELRRVGCYRGAIDGDWGPLSRTAMSSFLERVNAVLPVEKADPVQLRMLRAFEGQACGTCPAGKTLRNGRCIPDEMLAYQPIGGESAGEGRRPEPLPGRMAVGAPVRDAATTSERAQSRRASRRVAQSNSASRSYGSSGRRSWAETIFDQISGR